MLFFPASSIAWLLGNNVNVISIVLAQRIAGRGFKKQSSHVGMSVESDAEQIKDFSFMKFSGLPDVCNTESSNGLFLSDVWSLELVYDRVQWTSGGRQLPDFACNRLLKDKKENRTLLIHGL
jgi:hypothetical protein